MMCQKTVVENNQETVKTGCRPQPQLCRGGGHPWGATDSSSLKELCSFAWLLEGGHQHQVHTWNVQLLARASSGSKRKVDLTAITANKLHSTHVLLRVRPAWLRMTWATGWADAFSRARGADLFAEGGPK